MIITHSFIIQNYLILIVFIAKNFKLLLIAHYSFFLIITIL